MGIEFIKTYVEAAYYENRFCSCFSANDIHHLLRGYAEDYQGLLINIYELVLTAAMGCIIAGTDAYSLDISEAGVHYLCHQLQSDIDTFGLREQEQLLRKSLQDFISALPQKYQEDIAQACKAMREE